LSTKLKLIILIVLGLGALLIPLGLDGYVLTMLALAVTFAITSGGYNIILGYMGLFSFCHMAFAGLGAYFCLLLMNNAGFPFLLAVLISVVLVIIISGMLAYPALGLKGLFFGIGSLAVGESIVLVLTNLDTITGGTQGALLLKTPEILGWKITTSTDYYYLALIFFTLVTIGTWYVLNVTKTGKTWKAVRGNEDLASALGINVKIAKLIGFVAGTALAGLGGCIYLVIMSCLTPEQFGATRTVEIVMMVLIGGKGMLFGPLVGAIMLTWLPQLINMSPQLRLIVYGLVLIAIILGAPAGIIGSIKRYLGGKKYARAK